MDPKFKDLGIFNLNSNNDTSLHQGLLYGRYRTKDLDFTKYDLLQQSTNANIISVVEAMGEQNPNNLAQTGVDNIRKLNEQVQFAPIESLYKIYIIDEAHMLSICAFNAMLKTLEEPPKNTIFILATTEPHKIPVTIRSRCQQLFLKHLTINQIVSQLTEVIQQENIQIDEKALDTIARCSSGCMRDALSLLDQLYSFKGILLDATHLGISI